METPIQNSTTTPNRDQRDKQVPRCDNFLTNMKPGYKGSKTEEFPHGN